MRIRSRGSSGESSLVRSCLDLLSLRGVFAFRVNTTGVYDPKRGVFRSFHGLRGVSDILGVLPGGRFLAVECKVGRNKLSDEQQFFIDRILGMGGVAWVIRNVGELDANLRSLGIS